MFEIKQSYKKLLKLLHPDKNPTQKELATECFKLLRKAYSEVLRTRRRSL